MSRTLALITIATSALLLASSAQAGDRPFGLCLNNGERGLISKVGPLQLYAECTAAGDGASQLELFGVTTERFTGYGSANSNTGFFGPGCDEPACEIDGNELPMGAYSGETTCVGTSPNVVQLASPTRHVIQMAGSSYLVCFDLPFDCDCSINGKVDKHRVRLKKGTPIPVE